jgi:fructokinase
MIVVAGEALVDLVLAMDGSVSATLGGGPFNTARAAARLGSTVAFLGGVSRDRFGQEIDAQLRESGVDCSLVQHTDLPTTLAVAELDNDGSATYRFYTAQTSAPDVHAVDLPVDASMLHVGTLGLVLEPMATAVEHTVLGASEDVLVAVDVNCRPAIIDDRAVYLARVERVLQRADVVKVSADDLAYLRPGPRDAAIDWLRSAGAVVLHTDGANAVTAFVGDQSCWVPVPSVDVVDTIGAGDAFGGAFVAWWDQAGLRRADLRNLDLVMSAVSAAVEVAAINCTRRGADPPRRADLAAPWPHR